MSPLNPDKRPSAFIVTFWQSIREGMHRIAFSDITKKVQESDWTTFQCGTSSMDCGVSGQSTTG